MKTIFRLALPKIISPELFKLRREESRRSSHPTWVGKAPSDETVRDLLYRKVKNPNLMSYDIHKYNSLNEGDPKKTYQTLRDMITPKGRLKTKCSSRRRKPSRM